MPSSFTRSLLLALAGAAAFAAVLGGCSTGGSSSSPSITPPPQMTTSTPTPQLQLSPSSITFQPGSNSPQQVVITAPYINYAQIALVKDTCTGPRIATVQPSPSPTATPTPGSQLTSTYIVAPGGHAGKCAFGFVDTASNATASLPVTNFSNGTPPPTAPPTPTAGPTSTGSLSLLFICPTGPCTGYTFTTPATVTIAVNNPDQSADTQNVEENDTCGGIMKISASPSGYNGWNFKPLAKTGQCSATFTNAQSDPDYPGVSGQFAVTVDIGGLQVRPVR